MKIADAIELQAGGPGSGRRPEFGSNTQNKDKLNSFHDKLVSKGFVYKSSGGKSESDKGRYHNYVHPKTGKKKSFVEYSRGYHTPPWTTVRGKKP